MAAILLNAWHFPLLLAAIGLQSLTAAFIFLQKRRMAQDLRALTPWARQAVSGKALSERTGLVATDELGFLGGHLDFFLDRLSSNIVQLRDVARGLAQLLAELRNASERLSGSIENAAAITEQLTQTSEQVLAAVDSITDSVGAQQKNIAQITAHTTELRQQVRSANSALAEGAGTARSLETQAAGSESDLSTLTGSLSHALRNAREVASIAAFISEVTERMTLLALNASIEAARAGESGRGFAVVADEISKLAGTTAGRMGEINRLADDTRNTSKGAELAGRKIEIALREIVTSAGAMRVQFTAAQEAGQMVDQFAANADSAARTVFEEGAGIGQAAAEQKAAIEEIVDAVQSLSLDAESLARASDMLVRGIHQIEMTGTLVSGMSARFRLKDGDLLPWSPLFVLGIAEIDAQHQRLVQMINELYRSMSSGSEAEDIARLVDGLLEYTVNHFHYEEELFAKRKYPQATEHTAEHEAFRDRALEFREALGQGDPTLGPRLMTLLTEWLTHHIMESDRAYVPYLR